MSGSNANDNEQAPKRPASVVVLGPVAKEVRCPRCHALLFLARRPWGYAPIDEASVAIKCWRRTCKLVVGLR